MTLIVVSGAPGTGKPTVAAALAASLRWPLRSWLRAGCGAGQAPRGTRSTVT